ncbi:MAG TPA: TIGR02466 family protein [Caulobacteraceae bacterium]|nr:TIGR02466 family protein [Caulobacteraceae bacterium]
MSQPPDPSDPPADALSLDPDRFEVRPLFATPFICAPVRSPEALNQALRQVILDKAQGEAGVALSNAGGWQSPDDFAEWSGEPGRLLLDLARRLGDSVTGMTVAGQFWRGAPEWKINAWANVNRAGDLNKAHHHPGAYWSGVYWVSVDEGAQGGQFEAHDPRGVMPTLYAPQLSVALPGYLSAGGTDYITPKAGVICLFPAWLRHAVLPHDSAEPRISVAFNLCV